MRKSRFAEYIMLFVMLVTLGTDMRGQICTGNKGVNIFKDGDFGSGVSPMLLTNPNIAPGYTYTTSLPSDGFYSVTNNTGAWNLYPSWLSIRNNSPDPNGYMMVVNASFSPGVFYEKTINDICGNTLYEFSADVINLIKSNTANHTDPVIDFLIDGQVRFSTGLIPKSERWITYGFTFTAPVNASSVRLTLRNSAQGGFGNDLALDNISFRACGPSAFVGIDPEKAILLCSDDDPFTIRAEIQGSTNPRIIWQSSVDGTEWNEYGVKNTSSITHDNFTVGTYYYRYLTAGDDFSILNEKCRVISDVITVQVLPLEYYITDSICSNQKYILGNQNLDKSGNYQATLSSSRGCDSIVYLTLKVIEPEVDFAEYHEICNHGIDILKANFAGGYTVAVNNDPGIYLNDLPYRLPLQVGFPNVIAIESDNGCLSDFNVNLPDPMEVLATLDTSYISANIYQLTIQSDVKVTNINWNDLDRLDCQTCLTPKIKITEDTNVKVDLVFENGCRVSLSTLLKFKEIPKFIFSNIFSPNGDGNNDVFFIAYPDENIVIKNFMIFDRWGSMVFSNLNGKTNDKTSGWDGKINGADASVGVYQYIFDTEDIFGYSLGLFTGSVTLVR